MMRSSTSRDPGVLVEGTGRVPPPTVRQRDALSVRWDGLKIISRRIAEEAPIAITYNRFPYAVMMATPADLKDFGIGFSITERIISGPCQILDIEIRPTSLGIELRIAIDKGSLRDNRIWNTSTCQANFFVFPGLEEDSPQDDPDALWLTTLRSHDQFNTTIYTLDDRYRGIFGQRRVLFLCREEMKKHKLVPDELVDLATISTDDTERVARGFKVVPYDMPSGACAAYYPETNGLVRLYSRDEQSGTLTSKSIPVRVFRSESAEALKGVEVRRDQAHSCSLVRDGVATVSHHE